MIDLLQEIFQDNQFEIHKGIEEHFALIENGFFSLLESNKSKYNYYLVVKVKDIGAFRTKDNNPISYRKLFEYVQSLEVYNSHVDKNLSLLVVWEVESLNISDLDKAQKLPLRRYISDIEENPYFFKKQVLFYTKSESIQFRNHFKNRSGNFTKRLAAELNKKIEFEGLKKDNYKPTFYTLLVRMFIKISFLKMEIQKMEMESLQNLINEKIKDIIPIRDEIIENLDWDNEEEEYETIIKKIYNQIKTNDEQNLSNT